MYFYLCVRGFWLGSNNANVWYFWGSSLLNSALLGLVSSNYPCIGDQSMRWTCFTSKQKWSETNDGHDNFFEEESRPKKSAEIVDEQKDDSGNRNFEYIFESSFGNCVEDSVVFYTLSILNLAFPVSCWWFQRDHEGWLDLQTAEVLVYNSSCMMWIELQDL